VSLYKNPRSPSWWCRIYVAGREYRRTTGTADRRAAIAFERQLRRELEDSAKTETPPAVSIVVLAGYDLARAQAEGVTAKQHSALCYLWARIRETLGDLRDATTLTPSDLSAYVATRRAKAKGQTIRRELQALRRGYALAERARELTCPLRAADWPRVKSDPLDEKQRGKYHPPEILRAWLEAMHPDARDAATFALLTGLRAAEIARVSAQWIDPVPAHALVSDGVVAILRVPAASAKNRKERQVALTAEALAIITKRLAEDPKRDLIFGAVLHRKAFETARGKIGYERSITLRDLRHTHASIGAAVSVHGTRDALGHGRLSVTDRYVTSQLEHVAAVAAAVTGALKPEHKRKKGLKSGRTGIRNQDILRVKPDSAYDEHVSGCYVCQAYRSDSHVSQLISLADRTTGPEHQIVTARADRGGG
jgi:integrase